MLILLQPSETAHLVLVPSPVPRKSATESETKFDHMACCPIDPRANNFALHSSHARVVVCSVTAASAVHPSKGRGRVNCSRIHTKVATIREASSPATIRLDGGVVAIGNAFLSFMISACETVFLAINQLSQSIRYQCASPPLLLTHVASMAPCTGCPSRVCSLGPLQAVPRRAILA